MTTTDVQAIVLAAGKSSRFKTGRSKLLERVCGQSIILYPTTLFSSLSIPTTLVVGHQKEDIQSKVQEKHPEVTFVTQKEQNGTGHAILCTKDTWKKDHILIMNGDMPLVTEEIIQALYTKHIQKNAAVSFVMAHNADPSLGSYGRVVKTDDTIKIVEAKDFDGDAHENCCINAGIYIVKRTFLEQHISDLDQTNAAKEFYFTDLIKIASDEQQTVATISAPFDRIRGVNTMQELWAAEHIKRAELIRYWMNRGVRFSVAQNVHIDLDVEIGAGTYVGCGAHIIKGSKIGKDCVIHESSSLENVILGDKCDVYSHCILKDSIIGNNVKIGPFAHVREHATIGDNAVVGNFVEIKKSTLGTNTKAKHLSYLGDAHIGNNVNIGAGTITCNHNGVKKNVTTIKDNAYIGSNSSLVAPVTIGTGAYTAAGSTITKNVADNDLAIGRARQINKKNYASLIRERNTQQAAQETEEDTTDATFIGARKTKNTASTQHD